MIVARMWESRLLPERTEQFFAELRSGGWDRVTAAPGFVGGEVYRSPDGGAEHGAARHGAAQHGAAEHRAVVVTRWADEQAASDAAALEQAWEAYCARAPHSWTFAHVEF